MKFRSSFVTTEALECDPCIREIICDIVKDCSGVVTVGPPGPIGLTGPTGPIGPMGPQGNPATNITTTLVNNGNGTATYTNELGATVTIPINDSQTLSLVGDILTVSGGNSVDLSTLTQASIQEFVSRSAAFASLGAQKLFRYSDINLEFREGIDITSI